MTKNDRDCHFEKNGKSFIVGVIKILNMMTRHHDRSVDFPVFDFIGNMLCDDMGRGINKNTYSPFRGL